MLWVLDEQFIKTFLHDDITWHLHSLAFVNSFFFSFDVTNMVVSLCNSTYYLLMSRGHLHKRGRKIVLSELNYDVKCIIIYDSGDRDSATECFVW